MEQKYAVCEGAVCLSGERRLIEIARQQKIGSVVLVLVAREKGLKNSLFGETELLETLD